jgi:apolipoprotein N-acyltransferase
MKGFVQVFYVIFSSIMMALAIQNEILPFGSPLLGLFSLVPLYMALSRCSGFKKAGLLTSLHILLVHVLSSFWLGYFKDFAVFTLGATAATYAVFGYYAGGLFFMPFYITRTNALAEKSGLRRYNIPFRILSFSLLWTVYEWVKSIGFLAYPWGTLTMSAWRWHLITQIVDIFGTRGISFLFSFFSALVGEGLLLLERADFTGTAKNKTMSAKPYRLYAYTPYTYTAALCAILFTASTLYGIYQYTKKREPVKIVRTVLVQKNSDAWLIGDPDTPVLTAQELTLQQTQNAARKPDVVIWSENDLTYPLPNAYRYYTYSPKQNPLVPFIEQTGVPFIIGGPVELEHKENAANALREFNNSALYFDKNGTWVDFYGKIHLVPFAEVIPYADKEWVRNSMQTLVGFSSGWTSGKFYTLFDIPLENGSVKVSTPVCFEDAFPSVCRHLFFAGSEAFYNITEDSWSRTKSAELQHYVIASFRAQEFRTVLVRSTNSGFSSVTDPAGRILYSLPLFKSTSGTFDVPIYKRTITAYARFGDWFPVSLFIIWILFYSVFFIKHKHNGFK